MKDKFWQYVHNVGIYAKEVGNAGNQTTAFLIHWTWSVNHYTTCLWHSTGLTSTPPTQDSWNHQRRVQDIWFEKKTFLKYILWRLDWFLDEPSTSNILHNEYNSKEYGLSLLETVTIIVTSGDLLRRPLDATTTVGFSRVKSSIKSSTLVLTPDYNNLSNALGLTQAHNL